MCDGVISKRDALRVQRALPSVPPWHVRNTLQKYFCNTIRNKGRCDGDACRELLPLVEQKLRDWQGKESGPLQWGALVRVSRQIAEQYKPKAQEAEESCLPNLFQMPV